MGSCDVVLDVEWLQTLGLVTMDFNDLYMSFTKEENKHTIKGLTSRSHEIITCYCTEKLLKKGHPGIA
jgi:hypothetical protein